MKSKYLYLILSTALLLLLVMGVGLGSGNIPFEEAIQSIFGNAPNDRIEFVVMELRLPRTIAALLIGAGLSAAGLMMQTLFFNPLAGPYVLGVSSGASLGVALFTLSGMSFGYGLFGSAILGAICSSLIILSAAKLIKNSLIVLIVGVMLASFISATTGILTYFSNPEDLKSFIVWSLGDFGSVSLEELKTMIVLMGFGIIASLFLIKPLNAFLGGEAYVESSGYSSLRIRILIILTVTWICGISTAYCGPIAFLGLAVPNLVRFSLNTANHRQMMPIAILFGAAAGLFCDIVARLPGSELNLPINAVTSIIGAPVVIAVLMRVKSIHKS